jgi:hypothetical protein
LGLSAESPLYIAATAGAIALPTLLKMASIMKEKKTEWSTVNELPVSNLPHSLSWLGLTALRHAGRNRSPACVPISLNLRLSGIERSNHRQ